MDYSGLKLSLLSSLGLAISLTDINEMLQFIVLIAAAVPAAMNGYKFIKSKIKSNEDN